MRFGASPEEWVHWDLELDLTEDLLPLVCTPGLPIAPTSQLTAYGKVPSLRNEAGEVIGLSAWTSRKTTPVQIQRWMQQDYGICLQTRRVRALDVDVTDPDLAKAIWNLIREWGELLEVCFPIRHRPDSSKFLLLFELPGEFPKQTLQTTDGMIEFLANGQQCVIAGTHPAGCRYTWRTEQTLDGLPTSIPVLTEPLFRALQQELADWFGVSDWSEGRLRKTRGTQARVVLDQLHDPVVPYLKANGLILSASADGRIHVACPWREDHTAGTDETATTYFPAGTGGYEQGQFVCLHAHCQGRTTSEYLNAIGQMADGFEDLGPNEALRAFGVHDEGDAGDGTPHPLEAPRFERELKSGKIYPRLSNVVLALRHPDPYTLMPLSKDSYTDTLLVRDGLHGELRPFRDTDYTELALRLGKSQFMPIPSQLLREAVQYVAQSQAFDSAIDWLNGLPAWDGVSRVDRFCASYLGAERNAYTTAVSRYWWTAHAGRVLVPGIQADMAIVLISGQGTGKTSSIKAMVPDHSHYVELSLADRDDNLSRAMRGKMIGEIAELRGLAGRDAESLKAWVSKQRESWVPKWMEFTQTFPRRLVLVGTSNQEEFLADETGNRRWLPIRVGAKQDREGITRDRDQLWAEAKMLFLTHGILWRDAELLARAEHYQFEIHDPWEAVVQSWLTSPDVGGEAPMSRPFLLMDDVLREALHLDIARIHMAEQHRVGKILKFLGYNKTVHRVGGRITKVWVQQI